MKIIRYCRETVILIGLILLTASFASSQSLVERQLFSKNTGKSMKIRIWLPERFSRRQKYPVIYNFVYDHGSFIAATAKSIYEIPKCVVVHTEFDDDDYNYSSPEQTAEGVKYFKFLKNELIPFIEREYSASKYRVAMGISEGADYENYIFRTDPALFSAYAVFAAEFPRYKFDYAQVARRLSRRVDYFIATGGADLRERIDYAESLSAQLREGGKVNLRANHYEKSTHDRVILYAMPDALAFLFGEYIDLRRPKNERPDEYFTNLYDELTAKFGGEPPLGLFISNYLQIVRETKNAANVLTLVRRLAPRLSELDLYNFGYVAASAGEYAAAEQILKTALRKMPARKSKISPVMIYRTLALNIYDKQNRTALAFETLRQGNEKIKNTDNGLLYYIGSYAINKRYKIEEGIDALLLVRSDPKKSTFSTFYPFDETGLLLARGYILLNKKAAARNYLEQAVKFNPQNEEANKLLKEMTPQ